MARMNHANTADEGMMVEVYFFNKVLDNNSHFPSILALFTDTRNHPSLRRSMALDRRYSADIVDLVRAKRGLVVYLLFIHFSNQPREKVLHRIQGQFVMLSLSPILVV